MIRLSAYGKLQAWIMTNYTQPTPSKRAQRFIRLFLAVFLLLSLLPASKAEAQAPALPVYIVRSGDNLWTIAQTFYTTVDEIMAANHRTAADILAIGDRLYIPGFEGLQGLLTTEYAPLGISLTSLSRRTQSSVAALARLNRLTSPSELFIGRQIIVTTREDGKKMETMPALLPGQTFLEMAILKNQNPWALSRMNLLASPDRSLPFDTYYAPSDQENPNALAVPGVQSIVLDNQPFRQGYMWLVKVNGEADLQVSASLDYAVRGNPRVSAPQFFTQEDGSQIAYGGVHALADPGVYPLHFHFSTPEGADYRFDQYIILRDAYYESDPPLTVPPESLDDANIAAEDQIFDALAELKTPRQLWSGQWIYPTQHPVCEKSYFGSRRTYVGTEGTFYHTGLDLGYCGGIDIYAPADGVVLAALPDLIVRGNCLVIDHGLGIQSIYMHMEDFAVEEGQQVTQGMLLGHIGNTGRSAGPHLHFQVDVDGVPINPRSWLDRTFP